MLLLYFLLAGLMLGLAMGGRPAGLNGVTFRWWLPAFAGLAFQVVLFSEPVAQRVGAWGPGLYVASTLVVLGAIVANRSLPGFRIILLGAALNLAAILANGGLMPASPDAYAALTGVAAVPAEGFSNSAVAAPGAMLDFLGDNLVLPRPFPFANVFSIGDVVIGMGVMVFMVRAMRRDDIPGSGPDARDGRDLQAAVPIPVASRSLADG